MFPEPSFNSICQLLVTAKPLDPTERQKIVDFIPYRPRQRLRLVDTAFDVQRRLAFGKRSFRRSRRSAYHTGVLVAAS